MTKSNHPWQYRTPERRWYGFGRYYAMFPPSFAYFAVNQFTQPGDVVLDPFCGRGNAPFTASTLMRPSIGIDINPVAWLFTQVKLNPEPNVSALLERLLEIGQSRRKDDHQAESTFESMAWAPQVLAYLKAARRELDWKNSITDRTLMGFLVLHIQDKLGSGLSNSLWPTIACSPSYAVKWWNRNNLIVPPDLDPVDFLKKRINWRYSYGLPRSAKSESYLADAREFLSISNPIQAKLLITSPPYCGVTDYWNDHWIRLWMLGNELRKDWLRQNRFENKEQYRSLILDVFQLSKRHLKNDAVILVRSDTRASTAKICVDSLRLTWPNHSIFRRSSSAPNDGVSACHGKGGSRAREVDYLVRLGGDNGDPCNSEFEIVDDNVKDI